MNKDLVLSLCQLQESTQRACIEAKRAGREDLYRALRRIGWATADALAMVARDQAGEVVS